MRKKKKKKLKITITVENPLPQKPIASKQKKTTDIAIDNLSSDKENCLQENRQWSCYVGRSPTHFNDYKERRMIRRIEVLSTTPHSAFDTSAVA
ncbi:hypothetical protein TNCV_2907721 [Trichonephila clavipes]|nr:hypothetical protein TNCV_2907721 [Trichonephila clavipes]